MAVIKRPGNKYFLLNYVGVIVCLMVNENVAKKSLSVLDLLVDLWWPIFIQLIVAGIEQTINTKQHILLKLAT